MPETTVIHPTACRCIRGTCSRKMLDVPAPESVTLPFECEYCLALDPALPCPKGKP